MQDRMVEISIAEYVELIRYERIVEALKSVGVEDWYGYEEAIETVNNDGMEG